MLCCCSCIEYTDCIFNNFLFFDEIEAYSIQLQQHNTICGLTKTEIWRIDLEIEVCVANRGFKRNLTQLRSRYDQRQMTDA